jgi:hypothetical protein
MTLPAGTEQFAIALVVIAAIFYIVQLFVPIPEKIKQIFWIVLGVVAAVWAIRFLFGLL